MKKYKLEDDYGSKVHYYDLYDLYVKGISTSNHKFILQFFDAITPHYDFYNYYQISIMYYVHKKNPNITLSLSSDTFTLRFDKKEFIFSETELDKLPSLLRSYKLANLIDEKI